MYDAAAEAIREFYAESNEDRRLTGGFGTLEKARTEEIIAGYLRQPSLTVYDVGGGTGAYAFWLAELGHSVHLIDIVPKHVELARRRLAEHPAGGRVTAEVGDARQLEAGDGVADMVLLHGPLYHLVEPSERIRVLNEAARILKPGGHLLAFTINRFAGMNYAVSSGKLFDDRYFHMVQTEVATGKRLNSGGEIPTFQQAYFHTLDDIRREIEASELMYEKTVGTVGTAWMVDDVDSAVLDPLRMNRMLAAARLMEAEPVLSPTMCSVARAR